MNSTLVALWREDDGVLSFEWAMLLTVLVIGIVGGLTAARDAIIDELSDIAEAALNWDQSYSLAAFDITNSEGAVVFTLTEQTYADDGYILIDCARGGPAGQPAELDIDS